MHVKGLTEIYRLVIYNGRNNKFHVTGALTGEVQTNEGQLQFQQSGIFSRAQQRMMPRRSFITT
jgi:hypothetical protein